MGMFDDLIPQSEPTARITVRPEQSSPDYAGAISQIESGGRYDLLGPVTRTGDRAHGKYQVMGANIPEWTRAAIGQELTPQQFLSSPPAQDAVFQHRFGSYLDKYGPEGAAKAWFAGEGGMNNPNARDQLGTSVSGYGERFMKNLGGSSVAQAATTPQQPVSGGMFDDLIPGAGQPQAAPQAPASQQAPTTGAMQQIATDFMNQGSAASQHTTPNIAAQGKSLISADTFQNDAGEVMYRDPASGRLVPTDQNKHVALRDPADNRVKVYARTPENDEGALSAAGRLLLTGMASGAPTARPGLPMLGIKPGQEVALAADRLGVDVPKAVATDSMFAQRAAATVRNVPGAGEPLIKSATRTTEQLGNKMADIAGEYGGGTVVGSGGAAKSGISDWITGTSAENATKLYDKVDPLVNPAVTVPLRNTQREASKIAAMRTMSGMDDSSGAVSAVRGALERPEGLTYEGIKHLRGSVREMLDQGILPPNVSQKELQGIYNGLSNDLRQTAYVAGGADALSAFERANRHYALVSQRRTELAKIIGTNAQASPEQVFDRVSALAGSSSRADITKLAQVRKAVGSESWNEFVSGIVAKLGRDPAAIGGPEKTDAAFSPQRFLTNYGKLSDAGRAMLFRSGGRGDLANFLDDIATISGRWKELQKFSNPSGTSQSIIGGGVGYGVFADPLTTIGSVVGGRTLAYLLARPATAASVARWARTYEQLVKAPSTPRVAALNLASRNLINALPNKSGLMPADFLRQIQGPVRAPANQEQQ